MKDKKAPADGDEAAMRQEVSRLLTEAAKASREEREVLSRSAASAASLSSVMTQYQRFCKVTGGPIEIVGFEAVDFRSSCYEFPISFFKAMIARWQNDENTGVRHWPHMAFSASQFRFQNCEFEKTKPPSLVEIRELIENISSSAKTLGSSLVVLQRLAFQISDGAAPSAKGHLGWIDQFIAQTSAGFLASEVRQDEASLISTFAGRQDFLERVMAVEAASKSALRRMNPKLLKQPRGAEIRALKNLVAKAKPIWTSLTGRPPSKYKVAKGAPDFVLFVQGLAEIGQGPVPSFKQVQVAFGPTPPNKT